jgi:hypothetical protein
MSDVESNLYGQLKERSEDMTYHDRVERAVTVYLNLRRNGITKSEALRVTSICTDVPLRSLRRWRDCSLEDGVIPEDRRGSTITGKKRWMLALIDGMEEDLSSKIIAWVRANTGQRDRPNAAMEEIRNYINDVLLKPYLDAKTEGVHRISNDTARKWLKRLGFVHKKGKKCAYSDGHEAPENKAARMEFIKKIEEIVAQNMETAAYNKPILARIDALKRDSKKAAQLPQGAPPTWPTAN